MSGGARTESRLEAKLETQEPTQELLDDVRIDAAAQAGVSTETLFGEVGRPFDRRAPFLVGFTGALGVACAFAIAWTVIAAGQVLVLLGLASSWRSAWIPR